SSEGLRTPLTPSRLAAAPSPPGSAAALPSALGWPPQSRTWPGRPVCRPFPRARPGHRPCAIPARRSSAAQPPWPSAARCSRREPHLWNWDSVRRFAAQIRRGRCVAVAQRRRAWLHLVAAQIVFAQALKPFTKLVTVDMFAGRVGLLAGLEHLILDEDRAIHT